MRIGLVVLLIGLSTTATPSWAHAAQASRPEDPARLAIRYAQAFAAGRVAEWARLDLGCLAYNQARGRHAKGPLDEQIAKACWDATLAAHRDMVADEPEQGIFGAVGRGIGLGLLSEKHRHADLWREYPPAVFVSPVVVWKGAGRIPHVELVKVGPPQSVGLQLRKDREPAAVRAIPVDLKITYSDPLTAPLALRPEEVWWTSGMVRQYGPVRELIARFIIVTGLRAQGYPADRVVLNEALPDAPRILGANSHSTHEIGRAFHHPGERLPAQAFSGGLVLGSARWWTGKEAAEIVAAEVERVQQESSVSNRLERLTRLLLLDPANSKANEILGNELYLKLLREGLSKSGIGASDEAARLRLAELYWNLQAPTWRQEITAVATGYSPAAESLYGALQALELATQAEHGTSEAQRRLGVLYRWNNDSDAALAVHERLVRQLGTTDPHLRGQLLAEQAWDRIQWIAWNRRYDHPWLSQARQEAEQALMLVESALEKLVAAQALVMIDALEVSRKPAQMEEHLRRVRESHDQVPGVVGLWSHLIGNDLVKPLVPEAAFVTVPSPVRSVEVLDVEVHAKPPKQDLIRAWDFDDEHPGRFPVGFSVMEGTDDRTWLVEADAEAPTPPNVLLQANPCPTPDCFRVLLADGADYEYPDLTVRLRVIAAGSESGAGLILSARDAKNFIAAIVALSPRTLEIVRVDNGQMTVMGRATVKPQNGPWHLLRVQRINFAHVSRPRISIFFDGQESLAVMDEAVSERGRVGILTRGNAMVKFDGFHVLDLVSNQSLSKPAAY